MAELRRFAGISNDAFVALNYALETTRDVGE
jgi:hypothetical protein